MDDRIVAATIVVAALGKQRAGNNNPIPAFPHECVLIAYHWETTYDIECHIGSDISNNGRWRKDSGFDVQIHTLAHSAIEPF